jgi:hypothetical protein
LLIGFAEFLQMAVPAKRAKIELTLAQKIDLIRDRDSGMMRNNISKKYGVAESTVTTIWKKREEYSKRFHEESISGTQLRNRQSKFDRVEKALKIWFDNHLANQSSNCKASRSPPSNESLGNRSARVPFRPVS